MYISVIRHSASDVMTTMGDTLALISQFVTAITDGAGTEILRPLLQKLERPALETWRDENGCDAMHYAIYYNNTEAVLCMFMFNVFKWREPSSVCPYLHLACYLGFRTILGIVLEHRPQDYATCHFKPYSINKTFDGLNFSLPEITYKAQEDLAKPAIVCRAYDDDFQHTDVNSPLVSANPLDIAAQQGHLNCVKALLSSQVSKHIRTTAKATDDINLACLENSPCALSLLLDEKSRYVTSKHLENAVKTCITFIRPGCLDILLDMEVETNHLFNGLNIFHSLYSLSDLCDETLYRYMPDVTKVLLKYGHNPEGCSKSNTYPLYSLLDHINRIREPEAVGFQHIIDCLTLLLEAGADPNFNEFQDTSAFDHMFSIRRPYASSLHCFFDCIEDFLFSQIEYVSGVIADESVDDWHALRVLVAPHMQEVVHLLLGYCADVNIIGSGYYGDSALQKATALHQYCWSSLAIGINIPILCEMLFHGANPDIEVNSILPLNSFFDRLLQESFMADLANAVDLGIIGVMFNFMTPEAIRKCYDRFIEKSSSKYRTESLCVKYTSVIKVMFTEKFTSVPKLQTLCGFEVWLRCGRCLNGVSKLGLPDRVTDLIVPSVIPSMRESELVDLT